ncbi:hypothetical protein [Streptomyces sp. NPDC127098]|uniref:hypothetical protein n=1 Tax=Streptomyces sp. NPDC127098 TaxID=3347137 RepID=UPI00365B4931
MSAHVPTRSPYRIEDDEGPQTVAELKAALAPWPQELLTFTARLEAARFDEIPGVIAAYRIAWLTRVHPDHQQAGQASEDETADTISWDELMADYTPDGREARRR